MKRLTLTTLLISALASTPLLAQTASTETAPATPAPAPATTEVPVATPGETVIAVPEGYVFTELETVTADTLKGVDVSDATDSKIAEIADVVIGPDSKVTGVVTDVGGFLGLGEHRVQLSPEQIKVYKNTDNDLRAYVSMSKDELKALPKYQAPAQ